MGKQHKYCPFCKSRDLEEFVNRIDPDHRVCIRCTSCGATGPIEVCDVAAWDAWDEWGVE